MRDETIVDRLARERDEARAFAVELAQRISTDHQVSPRSATTASTASATTTAPPSRSAPRARGRNSTASCARRGSVARGRARCASSASTSHLNAWEPVIYLGGRLLESALDDRRTDALSYVSRPRMTDPARVIGAKPAAFAYWMFRLLGARIGDTLDDLYPGSGGIARAWTVYQQDQTA